MASQTTGTEIEAIIERPDQYHSWFSDIKMASHTPGVEIEVILEVFPETVQV
jgi:hypothetical protein